MPDGASADMRYRHRLACLCGRYGVAARFRAGSRLTDQPIVREDDRRRSVLSGSAASVANIASRPTFALAID